MTGPLEYPHPNTRTPQLQWFVSSSQGYRESRKSYCTSTCVASPVVASFLSSSYHEETSSETISLLSLLSLFCFVFGGNEN